MRMSLRVFVIGSSIRTEVIALGITLHGKAGLGNGPEYGVQFSVNTVEDKGYRNLRDALQIHPISVDSKIFLNLQFPLSVCLDP